MRSPTPAVSLVLISYQMTPQLRRTLASLAPSYQRGSLPGGIEVIVVDNGSQPPPTGAELATPGLDIALHHCPQPTPSPVAAVNLGIMLARAPVIAVMIDGARLVSPGLVSACAAACALHPRAVVATYNYHLGDTPQYFSVNQGYAPTTEAALLASIDWPRDGYRLFEISVPESGLTWPGPLLESNALFMHRAMWEELGGYDPRFTSPGGGAVNHDVFVRACALPGAQLIKVMGEATFHQVHGGTVTNAVDQRPLRAAAVEFWHIRSRPVSLLRRPGWVYDARSGEVIATA